MPRRTSLGGEDSGRGASTRRSPRGNGPSGRSRGCSNPIKRSAPGGTGPGGRSPGRSNPTRSCFIGCGSGRAGFGGRGSGRGNPIKGIADGHGLGTTGPGTTGPGTGGPVERQPVVPLPRSLRCELLARSREGATILPAGRDIPGSLTIGDHSAPSHGVSAIILSTSVPGRSVFTSRGEVPAPGLSVSTLDREVVPGLSIFVPDLDVPAAGLNVSASALNISALVLEVSALSPEALMPRVAADRCSAGGDRVSAVDGDLFRPRAVVIARLPTRNGSPNGRHRTAGDRTAGN